MKLPLVDSFEINIALFKRTLLTQLFFLGLMSIFRSLFFLEFSGSNNYNSSEIFSAFFLGLRLDLVVLGYIQIPIILIFIFLYFLRSYKLYEKIKIFLYLYFLLFYLLASILIAMDLGYFSFFNEHITLMVYGILDDDTAALWRTMQDNYNIYLIFISSILYLFILKYLLTKILFNDLKIKQVKLKTSWQLFSFSILIALNILVIRGTFGMYPLSKVIPDISSDKFLNEVPNNGVLAFIKATKLYKKSKSGKYDLIKSTHYTSRLNEAFSYLSKQKVMPHDDYYKAITYTTKKNKNIEKLKPNVVVVMVESGGLPIRKYQSKTFDIMGRLKKHFDEDTLFTNFISASNGTIVSLEPLLLNITARPNSTSLGQSKYQYTKYPQAAARVYEKAGYETHFIYGGDLKWRNVGKFMSLQGFKHQAGKIDIASTLEINLKTSSHDWGVFDEYAYEYVLRLLKNAKKPQFIFLLTTNNHPPFKIPKNYKSKSLKPSTELKKMMIGDKDLIQKRLYDYQYAFDMAGKFMDEIKQSNLAKNTVVAITADNNTIEGRIRYKNQLQTSKKIPFYLYAPKSIKKVADTTTAGSHKDLFPTLYNQTLSETNFTAVGKNLFSKDTLHCGFNDSGIIVVKDSAFIHKKTKTDEEKKCDQEYDAALAVSDWLIRINK